MEKMLVWLRKRMAHHRLNNHTEHAHAILGELSLIHTKIEEGDFDG